MINCLRHPFFLICLVLFCLNQLLELQQLYIWPLYAYLDDLLCLPITLTMALAGERAYFRSPAFTLPKRYILLAFLLFTVVFEGILPLFSARYTADVLDIAAYALGGYAFQYILNKPAPALEPDNNAK
ncbi:MAG: hypothetical protein LPK07_07870 [Hymenobacteraceae bacterium]|nr:hypothetical protein [Hymenobacteraceae bacterium]